MKKKYKSLKDFDCMDANKTAVFFGKKDLKVKDKMNFDFQALKKSQKRNKEKV